MRVGLRTVALVVVGFLLTSSWGVAHASPATDPCALCSSTVIVWQTARDGNWEVYSALPDGTAVTNLTNNAANDEDPAVSPDGRHIAFSSDRSGKSELYIMDFDGANLRRVAVSGVDDAYTPVWSPDSTKLAFVGLKLQTLNWDVYTVDTDGRRLTRMTSDPAFDAAPDWAPDGTHLAFHRDLGGGNYDIFVVDLLSGAESRLTDDPGVDAQPAWSPDGRSIAFTSSRVGAFSWDLFAMSPGGTNVTDITNDATAIEAAPRWSPDGLSLTFERYADPYVNIADVYRIDLGGTNLINVSHDPADDRAPFWGVKTYAATNAPSQSVEIVLQYKDRTWEMPAVPSATGADYWVSGSLVGRTTSLTSMFPSIADRELVTGIAPGDYSLDLTYGPSGSSVAGRSTPSRSLPLLDRSIDVNVIAGHTVRVLPDLSATLGVLAGSVRTNEDAPGEGLAVCLQLGPRGLLGWCLPLAGSGEFKLLLPTGPGTGSICRAETATATECRTSGLLGNGVLATFAFTVEAATTTPVAIALQTQIVNVVLRYLNDPPSAAGEFWLEGRLANDAHTYDGRSLGMLTDSQRVLGLSPGRYRLDLFFGQAPDPGSGAGRGMKLMPRQPLTLNVDANREATLTADLSQLLGVLAGVITINGASPGNDLSICVTVGSARTGTVLWCLPVAANGQFSLLLPPGAGTATVCLATAVTPQGCGGALRGGSTTTSVLRRPTGQDPVLGAFDFTVQAGAIATAAPLDFSDQAVSVELRYLQQPPSATGAVSWIRGSLTTGASKITTALGLINDSQTVYGLTAGSYRLQLAFNPRNTTVSVGAESTLDGIALGPGISFNVRAGQTTHVVADLSEHLGVIAGAVTINGASPGDTLALCIALKASRISWCEPLAGYGGFQLLLPVGDGIATVCRADAVTSTGCGQPLPPNTRSKKPNPVIATVPFTVVKKTTTTITGAP